MQDLSFLHAGFPFLNAGFPFLHAGFPFLHAGFPFLNAGFPFLNAGFPFLKTGFPFLRTGFVPRYFKILAGTLQNVFWPQLALYGSVWNFETGVLHSCSARIFCFFMPRGRFLSPALDFGSPGRHFGPGTCLGSKMGPGKSGVAMKSFCGGLAGDFPRPK